IAVAIDSGVRGRLRPGVRFGDSHLRSRAGTDESTDPGGLRSPRGRAGQVGRGVPANAAARGPGDGSRASFADTSGIDAYSRNLRARLRAVADPAACARVLRRHDNTHRPGLRFRACAIVELADVAR